MNNRKKSGQIITESHFDFLNEFAFNEYLVENFKRYFLLELNGKNTNDRNEFWILHRNFIFILGVKNGFSLSHLGRYFNRDHASVIHGMILLSDLLETNDKKVLNALKNVKNFFSWYFAGNNNNILVSTQKYEAENLKHSDIYLNELVSLNSLELNLPLIKSFSHSTQLQ